VTPAGSARRALEYLAILAVVITMASFMSHGRLRPTSYFEQSDTVVWYCAGEAVNERADPYRVEPLRSCEIRHDPSRKYPWVEPAPLPGYALAAFGLMARLPFSVARTLWFYVLVAAVFGTAVMLGRLARIPTLLALLCLAMVDGFMNLSFGELPPLVVAALVASAAFGASRRFAGAAICAAVATIEPHVGIPACLSMLLWWPKTRRSLVACGCVLAIVSIAAIGVSANLEYFRTLLPLHAAAEIAAQDQYSLTRVLHVLGFSDKAALSAGTASYLGMTVVGVAIARRVAAFVGSDSLIVLLPPAVALLGGVFVHDLQMAAAIPAALMLASRRGPAPLPAVALVALVFSWNYWNIIFLRQQSGILEIGSVAAALLIALRSKPIAVRTGAAAAGAVFCFALASAIEAVPRHPVGPPTTIVPAATAPDDMSSANWAAFVSRDRSYSTPDARDMCEKVPVWLGLIALTAAGVGMARTK